MPAPATLDTREFKAALKALQKTSSRSAADFCNSQMSKLLYEAMAHTHKADADRLAYKLGQSGNQVNWRRKDGTLRQGRGRKGRAILANDDTFAARIVNTQRINEGKEPIFGKKLEAAAIKLINARRKSVAFVKSGWLPAFRVFKRLSGRGVGNPASTGARQLGAPKGRAYPAKATLRGLLNPIVAKAENNAIVPFGKLSTRPGNPLKYAKDGLQKAIYARTPDMRRALIDRTGRDLDTVRPR